MIRRLVEKWLGYDRLLAAYEALRDEHEYLQGRHERLEGIHRRTVARMERQRRQLRSLNTRHLRALADLAWERFLAEENAVTGQGCTKIKLMDFDQAWTVADILAERFGRPMYAHRCTKCPVNPITRGRFWHVTKRNTSRKRPVGRPA